MKFIQARKCAIQPARHCNKQGVCFDGATKANVVATSINDIQLKKLKKYFHRWNKLNHSLNKIQKKRSVQPKADHGV